MKGKNLVIEFQIFWMILTQIVNTNNTEQKLLI